MAQEDNSPTKGSVWWQIGPNQYRLEGDSKLYTETEYLDALAVEQQGAKTGSWYKVSDDRYRRVGDLKWYSEAESRYIAACSAVWSRLAMIGLGTIAVWACWYFDWWPSNLGLLLLAFPIGVLWLLKDLWDVLTWRSRL